MERSTQPGCDSTEDGVGVLAPPYVSGDGGQGVSDERVLHAVVRMEGKAGHAQYRAVRTCAHLVVAFLGSGEPSASPSDHCFSASATRAECSVSRRVSLS